MSCCPESLCGRSKNLFVANFVRMDRRGACVQVEYVQVGGAVEGVDDSGGGDGAQYEFGCAARGLARSRGSVLLAF